MELRTSFRRALIGAVLALALAACTGGTARKPSPAPNATPLRAVFNNGNFGSSAPYDKLESFHPSYWGELAPRACLRLVYGNGVIQGGTCTIAAAGLNERGEPVMQLQPG